MRAFATLAAALLVSTALPASALAQAAAPASAPAQPDRREVGTLVYDGIPAIPAELGEELQVYQNARSAGFQDWLEDGSMLISTRFGETSQVHRVQTPGGARTQLTFFDEPVAGVTALPGTDRYAFTRDVGGAEYFQGFLTSISEPRPVNYTEPQTRNGGPVFSRDGRLALWSQVRPGEPDYDIIAMDPSDPDSRRVVFEGTGLVSPVDIAPDGRSALFARYVSAQESELWLLDLQTGQARELRPLDEQVSYGGGRFTADGRRIITVSDEGEEQGRLVEIAVADGAVTPLMEPGPWEVERFDVSRDGRVLAWSVNEDGYSKVGVRDLVTRRALPQPDLPAGILTGLGFSPDGSRLAIGLTTPTTSGDVWSWDVAGGGLTRWTTSEIGALDPDGFVEPELIRYPTFDDLQIPAFVYRPQGAEGRRPVIIDIHGGPEGQSRPGFNTRIAQWNQVLGATVIVPNVRGSSGYGKTWLSLDNGPLRQNSVRDIGALLDWVATQPDLDPERVVVYGGSYGGFMVLASMAAYADRLAGGVDIVGISNFTTFLQNTEGYRRDLRRAEYGDERDPEMAAIFEEISPLNLTDQMTKPLLVIQGANDPRVPRSEAEQIVSSVRGHGRPVWYLLAMDEGHGFRKKTNVDAQREVEILFLREVFGTE